MTPRWISVLVAISLGSFGVSCSDARVEGLGSPTTMDAQADLTAPEGDAMLDAFDTGDGVVDVDGDQTSVWERTSPADLTTGFNEMIVDCNFRMFPPPDKGPFGAWSADGSEAPGIQMGLGFSTCCPDFTYSFACPGDSFVSLSLSASELAEPCSGGSAAVTCPFVYGCPEPRDNVVRVRFLDSATDKAGVAACTDRVVWDLSDCL
jgi:hypothetical protein